MFVCVGEGRAGQEKRGEAKVDIIQTNTRNRNKKGEHKRLKHGDNSVDKNKKCGKQMKIVKTLAKSSMDPKKVRKRSFFQTHCFCTFSQLFSDVVSYSRCRKGTFSPEVLFQSPNQAFVKVLTNETPGIRHQ